MPFKVSRSIAGWAGAISLVLAANMLAAQARAGGAVPVTAPAAPAVAAAAAATTAAVTGDAGSSACVSRIECDPWLGERYKEILAKLLTTFVVIGGGREGGVPQQLEIIATLASRVIAFEQ